MQQRGRRPAGHPAVAVGGAGDHPLEEAEDGRHLGYVVEGRHEMHLRGAGIGETDRDAVVDQRPEEGPGTVRRRHGQSSPATTPTTSGIGRTDAPGLERASRVEDRFDPSHEFELQRVVHWVASSCPFWGADAGVHPTWLRPRPPPPRAPRGPVLSGGPDRAGRRSGARCRHRRGLNRAPRTHQAWRVRPPSPGTRRWPSAAPRHRPDRPPLAASEATRQCALPGGDERGAGGVGEYVHLQGAGRREQVGERFHVVVEVLADGALRARRRARRWRPVRMSSATPSSIPAASVMLARLRASRYSRMTGARPLATTVGTARVSVPRSG